MKTWNLCWTRCMTISSLRTWQQTLQCNSESVANKLEGKVMGTFSTVTSTVKQALQESLVQILQPQCRVDMLQDIMDAQHHQCPYVVTFCGVSGMGKSTNLAKISFWLFKKKKKVTPLLSRILHPGVSPALKPYGSRVTQDLSLVRAPLGPGSCPLPSGQEPENTLLGWLGNGLGARGWRLNLPKGTTHSHQIKG